MDTQSSSYQLVSKSKAAGCAAKIPPQILAGLLDLLPADPHAARLLTGSGNNEDAAILSFPPSKALVQTVDFFTPIVNDPYAFGQIAAANALSDVYAMGGQPWCAMNIVCFPALDMPTEILSQILAGGAAKVAEAGAAMAGGHSLNDPEIKYGLAVTGFINPDSFAANTGLRPGQVLVLTKPLGTGILATAIKAQWDNAAELEALLIRNAAKLNAGPGQVIRDLGIKAATDITGFGLGGHLLEMAEASGIGVEIQADSLPLLPHVYELVGMGLLPAGSHANRRFRLKDTHVAPHVDPLLRDIAFDAQTSGGVALALEPDQVSAARKILEGYGDLSVVIGKILPYTGGARLHIT